MTKINYTYVRNDEYTLTFWLHYTMTSMFNSDVYLQCTKISQVKKSLSILELSKLFTMEIREIIRNERKKKSYF